MRALPLFLVLTFGCGRDVVYPQDLTWGDPPLPSFTSQARLAITDNGDDTLSFVSFASLTQPQLLGTANVGNSPIEIEGPHHLTSTIDGRFIFYNLSNYVVNGGSGPHGAHGTGTVPGYLVKLSTRDNRAVGQVLIDRSPGDVILSADNQTVYVSHYDLARLSDQLMRNAPATEGYSKVAIIKADTLELLSMTPVCPTAHGMGLSANGKQLYVTCALSDELAVLDVTNPSAPTILTKLPVGPNFGMPGNPFYSPYALAVHRDGTVWISNNTSHDVRVFNPLTMMMDPTKVISLGGIAMFGDFAPSPGGDITFYVPHQGDDHVTAIDTFNLQTQELILPPDACLNAHALRVLPDEKSAVVVCEGDHRVRKGSAVFIDLPSLSVKSFVEVGLFPDGSTYLPPI